MKRVLRWQYRCVAPFRALRKMFPSALPDNRAHTQPTLLTWQRLTQPLALSLALFGAGHALADEKLPQQYQDVARAYASVLEWQGSFHVSKSGTGSGDAQGAMYRVAASIERHSNGRFTLKRDIEGGGWEPARGLFKWVGSGELTASNRMTRAEWYKDGQGSEFTQVSGGNAPLSDVSFSVWLAEHNASFNTGWIDKTFDQTTRGQAVNRVNDVTSSIALESHSLDKSEPGAGNALMPVLAEMSADRIEKPIDLYPRVSGGPGVFTFGAELVGDAYELVEQQRPLTRSRVLLYPVYDDIELEITIADYAHWRPLASIKDKSKPGNSLIARATLKSKNGRTEDLPAVQTFKFDLLDTTREPGITMNFPLDARDSDYDLRLSAVGDGTLSDTEQTLEVSESRNDEQGQPFAEASIDSYDFGGAAELMVTAILEDSREVIGKMKQGDTEQDIVRLPRRLGPDWIAAIWREGNKVTQLADDDDDEKVEGQEHNGDGYTLYEEYRGWVEDGRHIEGDPEAKDFFVLNLIEADAEPGIELFASLSQLRVHARLRRNEMSQTTRLMNGNRRDAPQRVKQHGVWVKTFSREKLGDDGAQTVMLKKGVAGRPGIVKGVGILARDDAESAFNKPFNLPVQDTVFAYDRAIAHELLHSVGVEHHGKGDYNMIVGYISPRNPNNRLGRAYFGPTPEGHIELFDENGNDVAVKFMPDYEQMRQIIEFGFLEKYTEEGRKFIADRPGYNLRFKTPESYANNEIETNIFLMMHLDGVVGVEHGEHAGHQDCVLRYSFAKFYEKRPGSDKSFYLVTPGTERIGMQICRAPTGTGINASGFKPQSRYGNAAGGEGNCFSQICPNDAIPPRGVN